MDVGSLLSRVVGALLDLPILLVVPGFIDESTAFSTRLTIIGSFPFTLKNRLSCIALTAQGDRPRRGVTLCEKTARRGATSSVTVMIETAVAASSVKSGDCRRRRSKSVLSICVEPPSWPSQWWWILNAANSKITDDQKVVRQMMRFYG